MVITTTIFMIWELTLHVSESTLILSLILKLFQEDAAMIRAIREIRGIDDDVPVHDMDDRG